MLSQIWIRSQTAQQAKEEILVSSGDTEEELQHVIDFLQNLLLMLPSTWVRPTLSWSSQKGPKERTVLGMNYMMRQKLNKLNQRAHYIMNQAKR